jgi:arabinogalactan oligomer / maltooligosaccharide transport system substrate-binding protein
VSWSRTAWSPRWTSRGADDYLEVATQAFAYDGTNYGLPYSIENIALIRNTELAPERPETLEEMIEVGLAAVEAGDADHPVGWQQNGNGDPFHNYWVVTGAGGYVFGQADDGSYHADDLGIDSEGGLRRPSSSARCTSRAS